MIGGMDSSEHGLDFCVMREILTVQIFFQHVSVYTVLYS